MGNFRASRWQIMVNSVLDKTDENGIANFVNTMSNMGGGRQEMAFLLNGLVSGSTGVTAFESDRKIALVLLLTLNLRDLDWAGDLLALCEDKTVADLAQIEWRGLTTSMLEAAYCLFCQVDRPFYSAAGENLRRLALELADHLDSAKADLLREKFNPTAEALKIWEALR